MIFCRESLLEELVSQETLWLDLTSSIQVRIFISPKKAGYIIQLEWAWKKVVSGNCCRWFCKQAKVVSGNCCRWFCKQAIAKLLLAYTFQKIFFIGYKLKHVHVTYSVHDFLIFFMINSNKCFFCLKFDFSLHQKILYVKTYSKGSKW